MNKYLIVGAVVVLVAAGGWWYFSQSTEPTSSETTGIETETTQVNNSAGSQAQSSSGGAQVQGKQYVISNQRKLATTADLSATLDSIVATSLNPNFSGSVSGSMVSLLGMNLYRKEPSYSRYYSGNVSITNGRWSASLETQLPAGTYVIDMYVLDGHSDFGNNNVITTATLTVN